VGRRGRHYSFLICDYIILYAVRIKLCPYNVLYFPITSFHVLHLFIFSYAILIFPTSSYVIPERSLDNLDVHLSEKALKHPGSLFNPRSRNVSPGATVDGFKKLALIGPFEWIDNDNRDLF